MKVLFAERYHLWFWYVKDCVDEYVMRAICILEKKEEMNVNEVKQKFNISSACRKRTKKTVHQGAN